MTQTQSISMEYYFNSPCTLHLRSTLITDRDNLVVAFRSLMPTPHVGVWEPPPPRATTCKGAQSPCTYRPMKPCLERLISGEIPDWQMWPTVSVHTLQAGESGRLGNSSPQALISDMSILCLHPSLPYTFARQAFIELKHYTQVNPWTNRSVCKLPSIVYSKPMPPVSH